MADSHEPAAMIPDIQVYNADIYNDRTLYLKHYSYRQRKLNKDDANTVLRSVKRLWGYEVDLATVDGKQTLSHIYTKKDED